VVLVWVSLPLRSSVDIVVVDVDANAFSALLTRQLMMDLLGWRTRTNMMDARDGDTGYWNVKRVGEKGGESHIQHHPTICLTTVESTH